MSYRVHYTRGARADIHRLYDFLLEHDYESARRARDAIEKAMDLLRHFPFSCRKALVDNPTLREMIIPFGSSGYVALFEIEDSETVTILAIRHQREDDYF